MTGQVTNGSFWDPAGLLLEQSLKKGGMSSFDPCPVTAQIERAHALSVDSPTLQRH